MRNSSRSHCLPPSRFRRPAGIANPLQDSARSLFSRTDCGHADASITLNWYAHAMPGNDEQAANLLAAVMEHPEKAAKTA